MTDDQKKLYQTADKPDVAAIISEFQRCGPYRGEINTAASADDVRFCRWGGQSPDGKKHDQPDRAAFPWDGASDTRVMLADTIIRERTALCVTAFWRAMIKPKAADDDAGRYAVRLASYFVNERLYEQIIREVELAAQYREHYGWTVLYPTWKQRIALRRQEVTLQALAPVAVALALEGVVALGPHGGELAALEQLVMDPTLEDQAVEVFGVIYTEYSRQQLADALDSDDVPAMKPATMRRLVQELREDGKASVPLPYLCENGPMIYALRPWDEVYLPPDTTDIQKARLIFMREFVTVAELQTRVLTEDYRKAWVEEAVNQAGKVTDWQSASGYHYGSPPTAISEAMARSGAAHAGTPSELIEVIHAFRRTVDADGVAAIERTTFHASIKDNYALHQLVDDVDGEYPFVAGAQEHWCRRITASRGVPEVVWTWQNELKAQRDGLVDLTSMGVIPPINEPVAPLGTRYKFAPGARNQVAPGREPQFMNVPTKGVVLADRAIELVKAEVDNYWGMMSERVPPPRVQAMQAMCVQGFLILWSRALAMMVTLAQRYMSDAEFSNITGAPMGWLTQRRYAPGLLSAELHFDVRELDPEYVLAQIQAVNQTVIPTDVSGVVDRTKWVEMQLRTINPTWSRELIVPKASASAQLFQQVQNDIALMFLGNEPKYVENDPTASSKLQFASQIVASNPNYQSGLKQGGRFAELMQKWAMNLQFSITQEQNKQVGRIGVTPNER